MSTVERRHGTSASQNRAALVTTALAGMVALACLISCETRAKEDARKEEERVQRIRAALSPYPDVIEFASVRSEHQYTIQLQDFLRANPTQMYYLTDGFFLEIDVVRRGESIYLDFSNEWYWSGAFYRLKCSLDQVEHLLRPDEEVDVGDFLFVFTVSDVLRPQLKLTSEVEMDDPPFGMIVFEENDALIFEGELLALVVLEE